MGTELPAPGQPESGNYCYMLRCADGTLYTGWTNDLVHRLRTHNAGLGGKYTRSRRPVELVYWEDCGSRQAAMSRERHLKLLSRQEKLALIRDFSPGPRPETSSSQSPE